MLRLNLYIVLLVLWLGFFFNIERLHVQKTEVIDIAGPVYLLAILVVLFGIVALQYYSISRLMLGCIAIVLFAFVKLTDRRPIWDGGYTYVTLFELVGILITGLLAYEVGHRTADFVRTIRMMLFADLQDRVLTPQQAAPILHREMQYSRRTDHPLTVTIVEAQPQETSVHLSATASEIQKLLVKRHRLVALTRLLTSFIRTTDFVLDQSDKGRIVFVTPEINQSQVALFVGRLGERAKQNLGVTLNWGSATFPEQGLTLEELVYQAERDLKPDANMYPPETSKAPVAALSEEPFSINASYGTTGE